MNRIYIYVMGIIWGMHTCLIKIPQRLLHDLLPGDLSRHRPTEALGEVHGRANEAAQRQLLAEVQHVLSFVQEN